MTNWNEALHKLTPSEAREVICVLLGRSGMSNEDFVELCKRHTPARTLEDFAGDGE